MDSNFNTQPNQEQENSLKDAKQFIQGINKKILFFTLFFKGLSILSFLVFFELYGNLWNFLVVTIFSAFDFWTTKNLSGRLLVGLKWDVIQEDGKGDTWIFESQTPQYKANKTNQIIFWSSLLGCLIFWIIFFIIELIKLDFLETVLALYCTILLFVNFLQFYKCDRENSKKVKNYLIKKSLSSNEQKK